MMTPQQIRGTMDALGIGARELAVRVGVTDDAVRKWLRGERRPSGPVVILLRQLQAEAREAAPTA